MNRQELQALAPPDGWEFIRRPTLRTSGVLKCPAMVGEPPNSAAIEIWLANLHAWATRHDIGISGPSDLYKGNAAYRWYDPDCGAVQVWSVVTVKANAPERNRARTKAYEATCCGRKVAAATLTCRNCYYVLSCGTCGFAGNTLHLIDTVEGRRYNVCANCSTPCTVRKNKTPCPNRVTKEASTKNKKCESCEPHITCQMCGKIVAAKESHITLPEIRHSNGKLRRKGAGICSPCVELHKCPKCKVFDPNIPLTTRNGDKLCRTCADKLDFGNLQKDTKFNSQELPICGDLVVPSTKQRPFRTISVETEMNGDGAFIARQLYHRGFISQPRVSGYNDHQQQADQHIGFLKHDGSVSGGELITGRINLDDREHAEGFMQVLGTLRALEKAGKAVFTQECGGHIHIDAHNLDFSDAWRYITTYNYLENVLYRLGGAGTGPLKVHRTLLTHGREYTGSVVKGPFGTRTNFGQQLMNMDRMCGLNFQHFIRAKQNCQCGAHAVENSKGCTCNLGKATIEWRVWNSTASPRILHGWIALMQALTAYSDNDKAMTEAEENKFPAFAWDRLPYTSGRHETLSKERLEWIHKELPLSRAERDSLIFAAKNSELIELGDEYLDSLLLLENNSTVLEKKKEARNPNRRERKIMIQPPTPNGNAAVVIEDDSTDEFMPQMAAVAQRFFTTATSAAYATAPPARGRR